MDTGIHCIIGLGNPGQEYADTRHNVGFWAIDRIASKGHSLLRPQAAFFAEFGSWDGPTGKIWLAKPITFMNRSGQAAAAISRYYRLSPAQILVLHDDLDLPPGELRLKHGGGHGGHNGLRDIDKALGSRDYHRLRIGIGHPGDKSEVTNYVLSRPGRADQQLITDAIDDFLGQLPVILQGRMQQAMNQLHRRS